MDRKISDNTSPARRRFANAVIFDPTPPYLVKKEMEELIEWVNASFTSQKIHPLLVTGLFVYGFLVRCARESE